MAKEIEILVKAREESANAFADFVRQNGPQMARTVEMARAILTANQVQIVEIQSVVVRVLEQHQVDFEAMRTAMQTLLKACTMPVFPRYALDFSAMLTPYYLELGRPSVTLLERLQADRPQPIFGPITPLSSGTEEATMLTGTASAPDVFGDADSPADAALDEIDRLFDEALQENDNFRLEILELRAEIRGWKLSVAMGWMTVPYPRLEPEDFDELERQP